ncbi:MAG: hypothetical protein ACRD3V_10300 [Vicinamibacteria bacterium]
MTALTRSFLLFASENVSSGELAAIAMLLGFLVLIGGTLFRWGSDNSCKTDGKVRWAEPCIPVMASSTISPKARRKD